MGSSKKHKEKDKEHKKKKKHKEKDRSRSRSKERKHKKDKKHSHEERDYEYGEPQAKRPRESHYEDQDYLDSHDRLESDYNERVRGDVEKRRHRGYHQEEHGEYSGADNFPLAKERRLSPPVERDIKPEQPVEIPQPMKAGGDLSLSIEETNRLRAKLGLKPLEGAGAGAGSSDKSAQSSSLTEDVHVPAVNISKVKKQAELREKLLQAKEKRRVNKILGKVKTLGDSDEDDDAFAWVKKSRKLQQEREMADKRAKILEEMDEEFGIGDLVEEEFGKKPKEYSSKDLKGIKVDHAQDSFKEGKTVILTLKDKGVLDEDFEDTLVNVNIIDDEHAQENIENKKKKIDYKPYEDDEIDEYGMMKPKQILEKYNEEIDGKKKETFELGKGGKYDAQHERRMVEIRQQLQQQGQALSLPPPILAREFYTEDEVSSFKKVKKKVRKIRKKPKMVTADDLVPLEPVAVDHGSRSRNRPIPEESEEGELIEDIKKEAIPGLDLIDVALDQPEELLGPDEDLTGVTVEDDAGIELELALNKARKLKVKKEAPQPERFADNIEIKEESPDESEEEDEMTLKIQVARNITLNQTSEFCRSLGEIPTYGMAGNRREDEEDELIDFEKELAEERRKKEQEDEQNPGWQQVEIDTRPVDIATDIETSVLDDEPMLNEGLAAALNLAVRKGFIEKEVEKIPKGSKNPNGENIEAINYSIEDKRYDDLDEKYRKRDRFGGGMVSDFKEKMDYKPEVKIEYIDDQGRHMCEKEAFRYLSHRFHGKGSGKLKTERRNKKYDQAQLMKSMTSTDTPLRTASMLGHKLKQEQTPYLVLSGANKNTPTALTKT